MTYVFRILLCFTFGIFVGCEQSWEPSLTDKTLEELKQLYEKAKEQAPDDPVDWAKEDLQRGGDWEYRVVALSAAEAETVEVKLNEYGQDRWEVFWVREEDETVTVYMKRPAKSYLRSVPLSGLGKAISGSGSDE